VRALVLIEPPEWRKTEVDLVESLGALDDVTVHEVPLDRWEIPDLADYDAVVTYLPFRNLRLRAPIPWQGYRGLKVMLENDGFMDYCGWWGATIAGQWAEYVPSMGIDLMVVSGRNAAAHFTAMGIETAVLPKGYSPGIMSDLDGERDGVCHYGQLYPGRAEMLRRVRQAGIAIDHVKVPLADLNPTLNRYLADVVCNMPVEIPYGRAGRAVERLLPGSLLRVLPGPEPMMKNFEATCAGCAVFMDDVPDLGPLGFVDGETAVVYADFDELIDKLRYWLDRPADLRAIGRAGAAVSIERHSWAHRAVELVDLLEGALATRS